MVGWIVHCLEKGRGKVKPVQFGPLLLLQTTFYERPNLSYKGVARRLRRTERTLLRAGVGRVVLPQTFPYLELLQHLRPVDPIPFWRGTADVLALGALKRAGIPPDRGLVALSAPRLCPELREAAQRLCPYMRGLLIDVPGHGEDYARWLHDQFGLPISPPVLKADVTVAFGPGGGRWGQVLELYGPQPNLAGLTITAPELDLPADCAPQLLTLLWEQGWLTYRKLCAI